MNCCDSMLKYIVFLCNFIFFLSGAAILGIGIYVQVVFTEYYDFLSEKYLGSGIILMVVGGVILIVAFFGCCGACTGLKRISIITLFLNILKVKRILYFCSFVDLLFVENACMMYTFGSLVALILIVEIGCTVTIFLFKDQVWNEVNHQLIDGLKKYGKDENQGTTESWNLLQIQFKCCGVQNYTDWESVESLNSTSSVPNSCCTEEAKNENTNTTCGEGQLTNPTHIYEIGCLTSLGDFLKENLIIVGIAGATIVVLQLIGVIVACCLGRRMKELQNFV